jgi:hypothetical protein
LLPIRENHPLKRLFTGLVENAFFTELGLCNPKLVDYVADLLVSFVHIDRLHLLRDAQGRRLDQIGLMLAASLEGRPKAECPRDFAVHRHIGDYALFWSGVYPERIRHRQQPTWNDGLIDYVAQGKRSYAIASDLSDDGTIPPAELLRELSRQFESCVHGLGLVRRGWEHERERMLTSEGGDLVF